MILGIISDAHGNHISLKLVLEKIHNKVDKIYFLGDAVGYFTQPDKVLDLLLKYNVTCILGNHDAMMIGHLPICNKNDHIYKIAETKDILTSVHFSFLKTLPTFLKLTVDNISILMVHGSPTNHLTGYIYPDSEVNLDYPFDYVLMGHTHIPFVKKVKKTIFANPGSCGLPRDNGNLLSYLILDTVNNIISLEQIQYNVVPIISFFGKNVHKSVISVLKRKHITTKKVYE